MCNSLYAILPSANHVEYESDTDKSLYSRSNYIDIPLLNSYTYLTPHMPFQNATSISYVNSTTFCQKFLKRKINERQIYHTYTPTCARTHTHTFTHILARAHTHTYAHNGVWTCSTLVTQGQLT